MIRIRLALTAVLLGAAADSAFALDIAPGTTSASLQAQTCAFNSGSVLVPTEILIPCPGGCYFFCDAANNRGKVSLDLSNYTAGRKFVESTPYTDFTVTASEDGTATTLDATIAYDISWKGGWTIAGVFTGWNGAESEVTLTLTDRTTGAVVRSSQIHHMEPDGFIGIDFVDVGFGLDKGGSVNTMDVHVVRGHSYRLALTMRCEGLGLPNANIQLDYSTLPEYGAQWNDLKVTVAADLAEEIAKLKKRVEVLEHHTHTYLTGRGEGHNNTEATTSQPILTVDEPTDDERRLLPPEKDPLPVKSVFLANAPNPFNPATTITYTLPEPLHVTIQLYTSRGQLVRTLVDDDRPVGPHAFAFDANGLASGVYYYRLQAGRFSETRKLTLLK